jgi:hypothetical protein
MSLRTAQTNLSAVSQWRKGLHCRGTSTLATWVALPDSHHLTGNLVRIYLYSR